MSAVDAPESFYRDVFGDRWIAHDAENPAVDIALMLAEQRLKRIDVALGKLLQHVGRWFERSHVSSSCVPL